MGTMAVLLPTVGETWLMQEECCWQLRSVYAPALPLRLASNQLHAASLEPVALGLDDYADAVPWADNYGLVYTWRFGAQLEPILRELIARGRSTARVWTLLVANPASTAEALRERVDRLGGKDVVQVTTPAEQFRRQDPLRLELLDDPYVRERCLQVVYALSTGCPWTCRFCHWAGQRRQVRDLYVAVAEMRALLELVPTARSDPSGYGLSVLCNEVTGNEAWLERFCLRMAGLGVAWRTDANVRTLTRRQAELLRLGGCVDVTLGVEFLEDEMLERLGKGHTVDQALAAFGWLEEMGIRYHFSLRSGVGETAVHLERLLANIRRLRAEGHTPEWVRMGSMVEWPGRPWLDELAPDAERQQVWATGWYPQWEAVLTAEQRVGWAPVLEELKVADWWKK